MIAELTQAPPKPLTLPSDQDATGRTLGKEEIIAVAKAIKTGTLTATKGNFTKEFEKQFAEMMGMKYAHACSSGSAAMHCAIAAIDPEPGDEIITTSITDMGALTPIMFQGAIPVFADVDPRTGNVTDDSIASKISEKTKAIIVTHLFGNPCDMTAIMQLAKSKNIPVIEDCAQAFLATHDGQKIGTFGDLSCFSLQQGKHITTGEGGVVLSNNKELARRVYLFINKAWGYGDPNPDHYFIALNYRTTELQSACALAQLPKLEDSVAKRADAAEWLSNQLQDLHGTETPWIDYRNKHVFWKYCLMVDPAKIQGGAVGMAKFLKEKGIASAPRYIQKPAFRCEVIAKQRTFGKSGWPFTLARPEAVNYDAALFPGTFEMLERVLVLPWNEKYTQEHLEYIAYHVRDAVATLKI
jgi:perosamine synthetase